ncbi:MAG: excinuclease ABC subunit UvrA, partial [Bacteroidales bacterium]|nr:excinuclease ABC subunit UvrA [Bacteroidales bacterium]
MNDIVIKGARVNNLKNIDVNIPRAKFVVITGISGSGKSSLAFDTLYAEGQRRYAQSLSSYARQFLGRMSKPDVDIIDGIPPAIAIEQKVNTRNPRSTVATTTEIYDYLRLLFSRVGHTFSPVSGAEVHRDSIPEVVDFVTSASGYVYILADLQWSAREDKVELLLSLKELGYNRLYADGQPLRIEEILQAEDAAYPQEAFLLVDRASAPFDRDRVIASVSDAFSRGDGRIAVVTDAGIRHFSNRFELDGITFREPDEYLFSFNSPLGACPVCGGLGKIIGVSEDMVIPDKSLSIYDGAIACWRGEKMGWFKDHLVEVSGKYGIPIFEPYCKLSQEVKDLIWQGDPPAEGQDYDDDPTRLIGIKEFFDWVETQRYKIQYKYMLSRFSGRTTCHACGGSRLRPEALWVRVGGRTIHELLSMNVDGLLEFFDSLQLTDNEKEIAAEPLSEIVSRLKYIQDVGLGYLTLNRAGNTLSGGESQRINLVTALGSSLVGSMYILDEPSIGLHPRDTERLIGVLRRLRDMGNTVVVVEHDEEIIRAADVVIDMGPKAGINGGEIVFRGSLKEGLPSDHGRSLTLDYLSGARKRYMREKRGWNYSIVLEGVMEHNLKGMDVKFPLGVLNVVTGVSGSGKSSLVGDILYPAMFRRLNDTGDLPGTFRRLSGNLDRITRVEYVDQNPIGKSSRSNAVTYLKIYDDIRKLLAEQQYARLNGFGPSYFSFNQEGGRCPECQGEGVVKIEMQFMADVTMVCETCGG